jgi:hypothetical protein
MEAFIVHHVPWTCRWGRFSGPLPAHTAYRRSLWGCAHPSKAAAPPVVDEPACEACECWEVREQGAGKPAAESPVRRVVRSADS